MRIVVYIFLFLPSLIVAQSDLTINLDYDGFAGHKWGTRFSDFKKDILFINKEYSKDSVHTISFSARLGSSIVDASALFLYDSLTQGRISGFDTLKTKLDLVKRYGVPTQDEYGFLWTFGDGSTIRYQTSSREWQLYFKSLRHAQIFQAFLKNDRLNNRK